MIYGDSTNALKVMMSYLQKRHQITKINNSYSSGEELLTDMPQGSVFCPLLFNIYFNNLIYVVKNSDIRRFADDITPHSSGFNLK